MVGRTLTPAKKAKLRPHGPITIQLYSPHAAQKKLHECRARFRVIAAGRRGGKTLFALNEMVKFAIDHPMSNCLWIAPVYRQCKKVYRVLKRALKDIIVYHSDTELRLELLHGTVFEFYSAVAGETLRGDGYHFVVMDECADIAEDVWFKVVRPLLADTAGRVIFIGTPKGRNWFYRLFLKGQDPLQVEWKSFTFPTAANPKIPKAELEQAKADLPEMVYEQEFLAVFHEESAGVFRGIDKCIEGEFLDPVAGIPYVIGWDVAKYQDFSVATVLNCATMHVDAWDRVNAMDYMLQIERVKILSDLYNGAYVLQDVTGVGDPVLEMLKSRGVTAEGYLYTNASKKILIEELMLSIEHRDITFPDIPVLVGEMRTFQYKVTPGRLISYTAPKGYHDDTVNSLALARHAAGSGSEIGLVGIQDRQDSLVDQYPVKDYQNDALLERQQAVSRMLGGIELIVQSGF